MPIKLKPQLLSARALQEAPDVYDDGFLRVEHSNYYVACGGRSLKLSRIEFLIISRLVRNADRIVPSEELWRYAWGDGRPFNQVSLHVHIYRLRRKLAPYGINIDTMVNVGYRMMLAERRKKVTSRR
jgi:two-component system, OmpR family, response regulator